MEEISGAGVPIIDCQQKYNRHSLHVNIFTEFLFELQAKGTLLFYHIYNYYH